MLAAPASVTLAVHRCRFIDLAPSPITALAFPPLVFHSLEDTKNLDLFKKPLKYGTLAVGHANGNIDICEWTGAQPHLPAPQAWVIHKTLPGPVRSKVDSLSFAIRYPEQLTPADVPSRSDLRLFSSGGGNTLLEWDMDRACVRRTIGSQGGSIWSFAVNPTSSFLALGCEDGSIRLLSLAHDTLTHHRRFDRVKCRLLSIAWGPPVLLRSNSTSLSTDHDRSSDEGGEKEEWIDSWLVTGGSDSSLMKWDVASGRVVEKMATDKIRGERTLVWAVGVLGDGTVVSGDSMGIVKFWDARTCTQLQSFQAHDADVLCLTIGCDGKTVYTSGVDQKICQFSNVNSLHSPVAATNTPPSMSRAASRWVHSCSRRLHAHDVRAIASWPPHSRRRFALDVAPIIASGGLDMAVVLTPSAVPTHTTVNHVLNPLATSVVATFEESYQRKMSWSAGPSGVGTLRFARTARLMVGMGDQRLGVWRIGKSRLAQSLVYDEGGLGVGGESDDQGAGWKMLLEMDLNLQTNLIACAISDDGRWLVVSDLYEARLFSLELDHRETDLKPRRVRDFTSIVRSSLPQTDAGTGCSAFAFTPDCSKLIMATCMTSYILVLDLSHDTDQKPHVLRRFEHHRLTNSFARKIRKGTTRDHANTGDIDDGLYRRGKGLIVSTASVLRIAVSADGQWLATSDDLCQTHVFNLDSIQHRCALPRSSQPAYALGFDPVRPSVLALGFADNSLLFYDTEHMRFLSRPLMERAATQTTKNSRTRVIRHTANRLASLHDPILGVAFPHLGSAKSVPPIPAHEGERWALFWGATWLCKVPLPEGGREGNWPRKRRNLEQEAIVKGDDENGEDEDEDEEGEEGEEEEEEGGRRHEEGHPWTRRGGFKLITRYRPLLGLDFFSEDELVVIERPLVDVLAALPPAYFKHKYGAA